MLVAKSARQLVTSVEVDRFPRLRFRWVGAPVDIAGHQVRRLHPERVQHLDRPTNAGGGGGGGCRGSGVVVLEQDVDRVVLVPGPALPGTAARSHARMLPAAPAPALPDPPMTRCVQSFRPEAGSRFAPGGTGFAGTAWACGPFLCREAFGSVRPSGFRASGKPPDPPRFSARGRFAPLFRTEILSPSALRVALHPPVLAATSRLHGKKRISMWFVKRLG